MIDFRFTSRFAMLVVAGGLVAACSSPSPTQVDYKSDSKSKQASLAVPPNLLEETSDQRSLPPQGGQTSLSSLQQVQKAAPPQNAVVPTVAGMHLQRDGTESWLVVDNRTPDQVWAQVRRFWQEQGFLLVVDQRNKHVMETDWNETRPQVNQGLIRNTLSKAMGNSYVAAERNKFRTRLESAPNGGTYVFVSQKGMREALSGVHNDTSTWEPKPNDPALETEYLKRLMSALALAESRGGMAPPIDEPAEDTAAEEKTPGKGTPSDAAAVAARNAAVSNSGKGATMEAADAPSELMLADSYDNAWIRVGIALDRSNFTVDNKDREHGLYFIRYVDPKDLSADEQGFWSQVFHGKKEKIAKQYRVNVRAVTASETRVAIVDAQGNVEATRPAKQIIGLIGDQLH
ncbi:outer membrane protein assembly factor BamC [Trinickia caryophylli]|uniref:Beta-barrel assembly machine subunit BamC n=1 Tax=Trinickia caryophylli TaxID=28094 RepID=A0A1X7G8R8_TRICW|nr:outer membrane protein assembly factor BamC [Trinickia caryophylli]PMS11412.1 outer membrane protein assembly factor BamC [Trinickia caryophylli]TRX17607.1 outer membrane protein assembly factor BamC [Trinickia caryophylli]WQE11640.1 outer membrane protein assembly factor BamC [Trinickia caryophylli]SMF65995.1 Beta-barrel assembly machine subunit BamC [Trinickia caryophylli]GLU34820.1 lipoprotein [Trinickia caryophylli]